MAALTPSQLAAVAKAAGFRGEQVATAVAVALGESGGNPRAHNPNAATGDNSYGLWQINMIGGLGPARRKQFGLATNEELFNPSANAKAAYAISSQGRNWQPWSVYTSGKYRQYLSQARAAAGEVDRLTSAGLDDFLRGFGGGLGVPWLGDAAGAAQDTIAASGVTLVDAVNAVGSGVRDVAETAMSVGKVADSALKLLLPTNMMRLAMGVAGFVFIFAGIFMLGREIRK